MKSSHTPIVSGVVALSVLGLPLPGYSKALLLLSMRHWLGPVIVYFTQRMAGQAMVELLPDPDPSMPASHVQCLDPVVLRLREVGFVELGRLRNSDRSNPLRCTLVLLQHAQSSDIAHAIAAGSAAAQAKVSNSTLGFSRVRSDGSWISTGCSMIASPFPPHPQDSVLRLRGPRPALDVWHIHQARVSADAGAIRNAPIRDALAFQIDAEARGVLRHIQSGYWRRDPSQLFLRPTAVGAVRMTLRMLFPLKQMADVKARLSVRRFAT